jgi:hypothetical protein
MSGIETLTVLLLFPFVLTGSTYCGWLVMHWIWDQAKK